MNPLLKALLSVKPRAKCARCGGSRIVTVQHPRAWSPEVCRCSACGGSGFDPVGAKEKEQ